MSIDDKPSPAGPALPRLGALALAAALATAGMTGLLAREAEDRQRQLLLAGVDAIAEDAALRHAPAAEVELALQRLARNYALVKVTAATAEAPWSYDSAEGRHSRGYPSFAVQLFWNQAFAMLGSGTLLAAVGFPALFVLLGCGLVLLGAWRLVVRPLERQIDELKPFVALARGTQMLAHDIRKPFTMVRMILQTLHSYTDMSHIRGVVHKFLPEVTRVTESVDAMIGDIMEFGTSSRLDQEDTSVESLIEAALNEAFKIFKKPDIDFEYRFGHSRKVHVDTTKILRVFSNVVCNAVQTMPDKGRIWFQTRETGKGAAHMLEVCIGNSGTFIPAEDLPRLFTPFYTKRKRGGTGLGLAIAEKLVREHGGEIWVKSDSEVGTEFWLTLPLSETLNRTTANLPLKARAIIDAFEEMSARAPFQSGEAGHEAAKEFEAEVLRTLSAAGDVRFSILVIDDEAVYRKSMAAVLGTREEMQKLVDVQMAGSSDEALAAVRAQDFDLIICDIDLGDDSLNGMELTRKLRHMNCKSDICIHSNRCLPEDYRSAIDNGANAFLPKPMSREHLLKLIINTTVFRGRRKQMDDAAATAASALPEIAVLDDDLFVLDAWTIDAKDVQVHTFESPAKFREALAADPTLVRRLKLVVTDFYFDNEPEVDGHGVADWLTRDYGFKVLVSSNSFQSLARHATVAGYIDKTPMGWDALQAAMGPTRAAS